MEKAYKALMTGFFIRAE